MAGRPLRRARRNPAEVVDAGYSPLTYFGSKHHGKKRLVAIDLDAPDAAPGTEFYKTKEIWRRWSKRGGKLKKPVLDEVIPGAPPHAVAFLDWHYAGGPHSIYIDYLHVRDDQRGRKLARKLIQTLIDLNPQLTLLDFGKMMQEPIGHLMKSMREKYKGQIEVIGRDWYSRWGDSR